MLFAFDSPYRISSIFIISFVFRYKQEYTIYVENVTLQVRASELGTRQDLSVLPDSTKRRQES
jgi:hypothetical protein